MSDEKSKLTEKKNFNLLVDSADFSFQRLIFSFFFFLERHVICVWRNLVLNVLE